MMKRLLFFLAILCLVGIASANYTLPVQALTNSPADGATTYLGGIPSAPTTTVNISVQVIPVAGTINIVEIYDYSGTAGTNQAYSYYLRKNNAADYLIATLSVTTNERVFSNTTMNIPVAAGDFFEIKRIHPTWTTNPLTNIVGGYVVVDTAGDEGYTLFGQALTNSPADSVRNYIGSQPVATSATEGTKKVFIPTDGLLTVSRVTDYSGTAGTAEAYTYAMNLNGSVASPIQTLSAGVSLRIFGNATMAIPVLKGNYLEWNRTHPAWATNPATNVVSAVAFVNTTDVPKAHGYPILIEAITNTPADGATVYFGNRPIIPSAVADTNKIYIRQNGVITQANVYSYSGTAGSAEAWTMNLVKNDHIYPISTKSVSANERVWWNASIDIPVVSGDFIEIQSVQPTFATNPATTIYGGYIYEMYDGAPPVVSFASDVTHGAPPLTVTFTDNSATDITSWMWGATNTINGTTISFGADDAAPVMTFDTGHWNINLAVGNASDNRTSLGTYTIPVNPSDGYGGLVLQDIYMAGSYLITFHVQDSNGVPLNNVTIISSASGQTTVTNALGVGTLNENFGSSAISFVAEGYNTRTISYVFDADATHTVTMYATSVPTASSVNTLYSPQPVHLTIVDAYGVPQVGALVSVAYIASSLPRTSSVNWLISNYGVNESVAGDMVNSAVVQQDYTESTGGFVFTALPVIRYGITVTNATTGMNHRVEITPKDYYTIYCPLTGQAKTNNTLLARQNATLPWYSLNNTHLMMGMTYQDTTSCTSSVLFRVWFQVNGTEVHNTTWTGFGSSLILDNHTIPKAPIGTEYLWQYNATRVC